ncbi:MAG: hypothetical protein V3U78_08610 [Thiotrichaceae bacterium]
MTRVFTLIFSTLTIGAAGLTYYDVGVQQTQVTTTTLKSVRSGSYGGGVYYGGSSGGGYRHGK